MDKKGYAIKIIKKNLYNVLKNKQIAYIMQNRK